MHPTDDFKVSALADLKHVVDSRVALEIAHFFNDESCQEATEYGSSRHAVLRAAMTTMLDQAVQERNLQHDGDVVAVAPFLSDFHDGGRSVTRVDFASGRSFFHKPRVTSVSEGIAAFLKALHAHGVARRIALPIQARRDGYVWSQAVPETDGPAGDIAIGELLALAWLMGSVDLHTANIRAANDMIYLIDEETVLHPVLHAAEAHPLNWRGGRSHAKCSPLTSGLVSFGVTERIAGRTVVSDVDTCAAAFERTLMQLAALASDGTLRHLAQPLAAKRVRVVLRPTHFYSALLTKPRGAGWIGETASALAQPVKGARPLSKPVQAAELGALQRGDIPLFTARADDTSVRADTSVTEIPVDLMAAMHRHEAAADSLLDPETIPDLVAHTLLALQPTEPST